MKKETQTVSIRNIPTHLWRKARAAATLKGMPVQKFVICAIQEKIKREEVWKPRQNSI